MTFVTSTILQTAMRIILPLSLLFALFTALKGHNEPGGGFIAGLIVAVAMCTYRMAYGPGALLRLVPVHPRLLVFSGLALALLTGVVPLLFDLPFLTSRVGEVHLRFGDSDELLIHYASAMLFDTGVLLVVIGVSIGMITRLSEELE